jgi:hypothetical protein
MDVSRMPISTLNRIFQPIAVANSTPARKPQYSA